jgi:hypothetical protein
MACFNAAYRASHFPVGSGPDFFQGDERCRFAAPLLGEIRHRVRPGQTLCVLPEGMLINYLARLESSVPFGVFTPLVMGAHGERRMLESLQARPPDYVLLLHRPTIAYGPRLFGRDYGQDIYAWVAGRYSTVSRFGRDPMSDDGDGFLLMALHSDEKSDSARLIQEVSACR